MLHATIRRTIKTVEKCQKELDEVKEKLKKVFIAIFNSI